MKHFGASARQNAVLKRVKYMNKETYQWYKEHHICVSCLKENADRNHIYCLQCRFKAVEKMQDYKQRNYDKVAEYQREYQQKLRTYRKENNLCRRCGKPASNGHAFCTEHLLARRRQQAEHRRELGIMPRSLMGNGEYCYFCGSPVDNDGDRTCAACHLRLAESSKNARKHIDYKSHKWCGMNEATFEGGNAE